MFLLKTMKHLLLYICDNHLHLLASKLYIVNALFADVWSQIYLLWDYYDQTVDLTAFVFDNSH